jgi:hypothetical protein
MQLLGVSFGEGNEKLGSIFTFSLPSQITCPGSSQWCRKKCYGKRYERLRFKCRNAYERNFALSKTPEKFSRLMIGVIPRILSSFRIHVSGDFYCQEYIESWIKICSTFPTINFWAYTRSWNVISLIGSLKKLRNLSNVQLFASTDPTMPLPPKDWRIAFIDEDFRAEGIDCPAQINERITCLTCGYCLNKDQGNVVFKVH